MACALVLLAALLGGGVVAAQAQEASVDTLAVLLRGSQQVSGLAPGAASPLLAVQDTVQTDLPPGALEMLERLNVRGVDLRDVFRGIAVEHNLNLFVDDRINYTVTVRFSELPVIEALEFLCKKYRLELRREGHIFHIVPPPEPVPEPEPQPTVSVRDSLLTVDLQDDDLEKVMRLITQQSGTNILVRRGVRGTLTGILQNVSLDQGIRTLVLSNGFSVRVQEGIYHIDRTGLDDTEGQDGTKAFWVQVEDSLITLDVVNAKISDVLREIGAQMEASLITYNTPEGRISASADSLDLDTALNLLLKGTNVTFRKEDNRYFIGDKSTNGIAETRLIRLEHIRPDIVMELVPSFIQENATIKVVKEHNGLLVTGSNDVILELESFVTEVDYPTPQILIEALVVDFESNDMTNIGVSFGRDAETAAAEAATGYRFNGDLEIGDDSGFSISGDGRQTSDLLSDLTRPIRRIFGLGSITRLPDDFYVRINALVRNGQANIISRPQIATLSGTPASLSIGTTQYFLLRTNTPFQNPTQTLFQNSQRFEKIEANIGLEVTPWVSASGDITVEIRPEFSLPVGEFNPEVPPTINTRVMESTVRLRDGETIILGGMIQEKEMEVRNKVPILGSIPLLGRLFRSRSTEKEKSELVIFITPHVFYGDERDNEKWEKLREEMHLEGLKKKSTLQKIIDG